MGRVVGFEPTHNGTTIRGLNHLTIPAISMSIITNQVFSASGDKLLFIIVEDTKAIGQEGTGKGSETMLKYDIIYGFADKQ